MLGDDGWRRCPAPPYYLSPVFLLSHYFSCRRGRKIHRGLLTRPWQLAQRTRQLLIGVVELDRVSWWLRRVVYVRATRALAASWLLALLLVFLSPSADALLPRPFAHAVQGSWGSFMAVKLPRTSRNKSMHACSWEPTRTRGHRYLWDRDSYTNCSYAEFIQTSQIPFGFNKETRQYIVVVFLLCNVHLLTEWPLWPSNVTVWTLDHWYRLTFYYYYNFKGRADTFLFPRTYPLRAYVHMSVWYTWTNKVYENIWKKFIHILSILLQLYTKF